MLAAILEGYVIVQDGIGNTNQPAGQPYHRDHQLWRLFPDDGSQGMEDGHVPGRQNGI